jgi:hypothetical protein
MFSEHIEDPFDGFWPEVSPAHTAVPRRSTLDGFALEPGCSHGVALESLTAGTVLDVQTRHNHYRLVVLDPAQRQVRIRGGSAFPESTDVRVAGATAGGSALKLGWIGEGLRLELSTDLGPVTTSTVESVTVDDEMAA